jgi:predicted small metal-binding protein
MWPSYTLWRSKEIMMAQQIRCECGYIARGDSDDAVVQAIEQHMSTDHPEVLASIDRQDIYGWIEQF